MLLFNTFSLKTFKTQEFLGDLLILVMKLFLVPLSTIAAHSGAVTGVSLSWSSRVILGVSCPVNRTLLLLPFFFRLLLSLLHLLHSADPGKTFSFLPSSEILLTCVHRSYCCVWVHFQKWTTLWNKLNMYFSSCFRHKWGLLVIFKDEKMFLLVCFHFVKKL